MLLIVFDNEQYHRLQQKYSQYVEILDINEYKYIAQGIRNSEYPINILEQIKQSLSKYDITIIYYDKEIMACLTAIDINYTLLYTSDNPIEKQLDCNKIFININEIEELLYPMFEWINIPIIEENENKEIEISKNVVEEPPLAIEPTIEDLKQKEDNISVIPQNKNKLTFEQLLDENVEITESDVRDLKATQNKLKVGMLLQAKSMLNRVLKLTTILDKLYDKLLDRIEDSIDTTDTASLMYTTDYISKALNDTNQFMMSLINNEKIQNFFIIDNSTVINTSSDNRVALNQREKIRKAAEIVLNNIDYVAEGDFTQIENPNEVIEVKQEDKDNGSTTT